MKIFRGVLLLILASVILSCDAPRLNPFDPSGEDYKLADFSGDVYTYEQPRVPISKVTVTWKNQNITSLTDSLGKFLVEDVPRVNGWVYFEKIGYSKDSSFIDWKNQNAKQVGTVLLSYTFGDLDGFIQNIDQQSISKVKVFWENQKITVESDLNGYYKIENVPIRNGMIYFEKEGFKTDTLWVEWKEGKSKRLEARTLQYNIGDLEGTVQTSDAQPQLIEGVHVRWKGLTTVSVTASDGKYKFTQIPIKNGTLYFEKEGFKTDSLLVQWSGVKTKTVQAYQLQYTSGDLEGTVQTPDIPHLPLEKVSVRWKGLTTVSITDASGKYKFSQIPIKNGTLYFEKEGFKSDSLFVQWSGGKTKQVEAYSLQYTHGNLSGTIYTFDTPRLTVEKVFVRVKGLTTIVETNSAGEYLFANIPIKSGAIYFEKEGFKKDSVTYAWESGKSKRVDGYIKYQSGVLSGRVLTEKFPRQPISNVKVFWKNQSILKETSSDGLYKIEGVPTTDGYVYFEKTGYSPDSLFVQWGTKNEVVNQEKYLNAIPQIDSLAIYSSVQNKFADEPKTRMTVQVKISDAENDIDGVFVQNKQLNVFALLDYNQSTKYYQREFSVADLNVTSIDEAIGRNFEIVVEDGSNKTFNLGSSTPKRIIRQEIITYSPKDNAVANADPTLSWQRYLPGFNFKYYIQIYTNDVPPSLVWEGPQFSKDEISLTPTVNLPKGEYFWIIWCVDDFQNRGSSKPNTFKVQ